MQAQRIQAEIAAALAARHAQRDRIERLVHAWRDLCERFGALVELAERTRLDPALPAGGRADELAGALRPFLDGGRPLRLRRGLAAATDRLDAVRERATRPTLNIGVIGQTQMGKSTLLRAISGLDEHGTDVLPTSADLLPTTAARSRIHNAPAPRAEVVLRTFEEFREVYLRPRHEALAMPVPQRIEDFAAVRYPSWEEFSRAGRPAGLDAPSNEEHLARLRLAQAALPGYRDLFEGSRVREIALAEVPGYVSYPPEPAPPGARRRYLAVRDVRIHHPFPNNPVRDLALIDLPGTEERGLDVARQFMRDLRNEVDLLVQVKRPSRTTVLFGAADAELQELAHASRAGVELGDFLFVVLNRDRRRTDLTEEEFADAVEQARRAAAPHGVGVLDGDLISREEVAERVLRPVLTHLARNLAAMDRAALRDAHEATVGAGRDASAAGEELAAAIRAAAFRAPSDEQRLAEIVPGVVDELADDLAHIRDGYLARVREGLRSEELDAATAAASGQVRAWLADGFGSGGHDVWAERARKKILVFRKAAVEQEFIRARHFVAGTFRRLVDASLAQAIGELQGTVAAALWARLPEAVLPADRTLPAFAAALRAQGLGVLAAPIEDLAALSVSYGDQSLFLRVVQPIAVGIDQDGPGAAGEPAAPAAPGAHRRDGAERDLRLGVSVAPWAIPAEINVSTTIPLGRRRDVRGLSADRAAAAIPVTESAEETVRWLAGTLTAVVEDVLARLTAALQEESAAAVRALFACADQFFDGFLRNERTTLELGALLHPHLRAMAPDDGPARLAAAAGDLERAARAVTGSAAAYESAWAGV
ncbi:hypothetical protein [Actinomadura sp. NEAU-AAG7]|uniref:hypothetical protein n=1 Tax=Actinomadura sp. NEAU-AAG7 TaxID=2839640 RepID=UPI001BE4BB5E|nr:hypothetical protein [Actinomadura sp. NEAU-AAG7]MBT2212546.1 hypothetical protein [Actinomadura sp. NEAU-AAG7]